MPVAWCLRNVCICRDSSSHSVPFKYEKTTWAVRDVDSCVETLLELLQMYRAKPGDRVADKSASIFTRTCCLLAVLVETTNGVSVSTDHLAEA